MFASDSFTGEHKATFGSWSAQIETQPTPRIVVDIDLRSVHVHDMPFADAIVKDRLLQVERYPRASFVATIAPTAGATGDMGDMGESMPVVIEGVADLHGVKRNLRVLGTLTQEKESYRFRTTFTVSRLWFDIRYGGLLEPFIADDVRLEADVVATPEEAPPP